MDRERFNDMEVMEQIDYINNNLINKSLTKLCNDIQINKLNFILLD